MNQSDIENFPDSDDAADFDPDIARNLIGKTVLIGITWQNLRGEATSREQFHGIVQAAEAGKGICVALQGSHAGEIRWLPPATHAFSPADKGAYRLKSTGETVDDPDFFSTWTVTRPDD